ncbi:MAG: restriction endonuclease subunit S [Azonexus sp.]|nr:restriction endonuclease subunit S [Azonexus sp.]MCK6412573.1 restriction endonuclease subunit S [Azonexus sp.]
MSSESQEFQLDEICDFVNGFAFKPENYIEKSAETYEVFRMGYIGRGGGFKEDSSPVFVSRSNPKLDKYRLRRGDIVIAMTDMKDKVAILGNTARVPQDDRFVLNQRAGLIRVSKPDIVCPIFLYYYSNWKPHVDYLRARANSGVQVNLSTGAIKEAKLLLPPLAEQRQIGSLLSSLDDRITLLRETNATLEAIAQALFKSWFVDFDPVRAKQAGRAPEGMSDATAALFPDSFEESELGLVPKGWRLVPFGQLLSHTIGGDWGSEAPDDKNDVRVAIIRGTDIPDLQSGANSRVPVRYTSQKKLATRKLEDGDIVLEVSGGSKDQPTGRALYLTDGLLGQFDCPVEPASFCRLLRPNTKDIGLLLGQHLTYIYAQGKTWEYQNQSTGIANFQTTHFLETELVAVPDDEVLAEFAKVIRPIVDRAHLTQVQELATLRDTLLPRLISGQLRLPEAETLVKEASSTC